MNIVVTGATSFIGRHLVNRLLQVNDKHDLHIKAIVRKGCKKLYVLPKHADVRIIELDLKDYAHLGELCGQVDCLVHMAWEGVRGTERLDHDLQRHNYLYSLDAIKSVESGGCSRIILAGSQAEYGIKNEVITENTVCTPNTAYGLYKLELYNEAAAFCKNAGISIKEPRYFSLYGVGDYNNSLIMTSVRNMLKNEVCRYTECTQKWDFLYIEDAIDALIGLCFCECADGAYNFGSGDCRVLKEYVEEIKLILHSSSQLRYGVIPYTDAGVVSIQPSIEKLKQELNWKPKTSFQEGILAIAKKMNGMQM